MTPSEQALQESRSASRWFWRSLIAIPVLLLAVFVFGARVDIMDYVASHELRITTVKPSGAAPYAHADWSLVSARFADSGEGTRLPLPKDRRLLIVRLKAVPEEKIVDEAQRQAIWLGCSLTLLDGRGQRWSPLSFVLSRDISRALEPTATPVAGCFEAARSIGLDGQPTLVEEKFLLPAEIASDLSVRLSFRSALPDALSFPLEPR
ncbi:hypothetical protein BA190_11270 [Labrys sp. WJW]|uniref:hypothetical protein n=1 Tax=Labrys sp. WJW TaxID=1737983 RepID=UPI00082AE06E|nr:hypothetical protein [Labrys sp. WJW]OCC04962.1 hypothetical protein BA190_11270 [Labrys sp. WJW]